MRRLHKCDPALHATRAAWAPQMDEAWAALGLTRDWAVALRALEAARGAMCGVPIETELPVDEFCHRMNIANFVLEGSARVMRVVGDLWEAGEKLRTERGALQPVPL